MNIHITIPDYDGQGTDVIWENGAKYDIKVFEEENEKMVLIRANKQGMISLAKQMIYFA